MVQISAIEVPCSVSALSPNYPRPASLSLHVRQEPSCRRRPRPAIGLIVGRCNAASLDRPFVHRAAFSGGERRQCGTKQSFLQLNNPVRLERLEKHLVVADHQYCSVISRQRGFQSFDTVKIEVIGRLSSRISNLGGGVPPRTQARSPRRRSPPLRLLARRKASSARNWEMPQLRQLRMIRSRMTDPPT